jgi:hypothetical protein
VVSSAQVFLCISHFFPCILHVSPISLSPSYFVKRASYEASLYAVFSSLRKSIPVMPKYSFQLPAEDPDVDGKITLEWILGKESGKLWTKSIWLRVGTTGVLLYTQK